MSSNNNTSMSIAIHNNDEDNDNTKSSAATTTPNNTPNNNNNNNTKNENQNGINNTMELYHDNLMRLQSTELLNESLLPISYYNNSSSSVKNDTFFTKHKKTKWEKDSRNYINSISTILKNMDSTILSPDVVLIPNKEKDDDVVKRTWIQLQSDRALRHFNTSTSTTTTTTNSNNSNNNNNNQWKFPFHGGKSFTTIEPINSYALPNGAGLTTKNGNAMKIPVLDLGVLIGINTAAAGAAASLEGDDDDDMNEDEDEMEEEEDGNNDKKIMKEDMIGGKDYLNGRYFDVSYIYIYSMEYKL